MDKTGSWPIQWPQIKRGEMRQFHKACIIYGWDEEKRFASNYIPFLQVYYIFIIHELNS